MVKLIIVGVLLLSVVVVVVIVLRSQSSQARTDAGASDTTTAAISLTLEDLEQALRKLLERDSGAFLIVEITDTNGFVQFVGSMEDPLLLDLPFAPLIQSQIEQARAALSSEPGFSETAAGFNATYGTDTRAAATMAKRLLQEIYGAEQGDSLSLKYDSLV